MSENNIIQNHNKNLLCCDSNLNCVSCLQELLRQQKQIIECQNQEIKKLKRDKLHILDFNKFSVDTMKKEIDILKERLKDKTMSPTELPWIKFRGHVLKPYHAQCGKICKHVFKKIRQILYRILIF